MNSQVHAVRNETAENSTSTTSHAYARPPVDIVENKAGFVLFADLPGVTRENLTIRVDGDSLVIEGILGASSPDEMELTYSEAQFSAYRRQFTLSRELDRSNIQANLSNGVLKLTIPKTEEAKPRRIEVTPG